MRLQYNLKSKFEANKKPKREETQLQLPASQKSLKRGWIPSHNTPRKVLKMGNDVSMQDEDLSGYSFDTPPKKKSVFDFPDSQEEATDVRESFTWKAFSKVSPPSTSNPGVSVLGPSNVAMLKPSYKLEDTTRYLDKHNSDEEEGVNKETPRANTSSTLNNKNTSEDESDSFLELSVSLSHKVMKNLVQNRTRILHGQTEPSPIPQLQRTMVAHLGMDFSKPVLDEITPQQTPTSAEGFQEPAMPWMQKIRETFRRASLSSGQNGIYYKGPLSLEVFARTLYQMDESLKEGQQGKRVPKKGKHFAGCCSKLLLDLLDAVVDAEEAVLGFNTVPINTRRGSVSGPSSPSNRPSPATPRRNSSPGPSVSTRKKRQRKKVHFTSHDFSTPSTPNPEDVNSTEAMHSLLSALLRLLRLAFEIRRLCKSVSTESPTDSLDLSEAKLVREESQLMIITLKILSTCHSDQSPDARFMKACRYFWKELDELCFGDVSRSQILKRFYDSLSSCLRYELKCTVNQCNCENIMAEDQEKMETMSTGSYEKSGRGDEQRNGSEEGVERPPCGRLLCISGTGNLRFNDEDPAALVNHALRELAAHPMLCPLLEGATRLIVSDLQKLSGNTLTGLGCPPAYDADADENEDPLRTLSPEDPLPNCDLLLEILDGYLHSYDIEEIISDQPKAPSSSLDTSSHGSERSCTSSPRQMRSRTSSRHNNTVDQISPDEVVDLLNFVAAHEFMFQILTDENMATSIEQGLFWEIENLAKLIHEFERTTADPSLRKGIAKANSGIVWLAALSDISDLKDRLVSEMQIIQVLRVALQRELLGISSSSMDEPRTKTRSSNVSREDDVISYPIVHQICELDEINQY